MSREFTALRANVEKEFSPNMIIQKDRKFKVKAIPSGSLALDYALGKGGWPMGTIVEVYGARDIGKSSLIGFNAIKEAQKMGLKCVIISIEAGFDYEWAEINGVDISEDMLLPLDPETAEEAFGLLHMVVTSASAKKQEIGVVLVDSIGSILSKGEMEGDGTMKMAGQSGLITFGVKRVQKAIERNNVLCILINQIRDNLNAPSPGIVKPAGPHALHHLSQVIVHLKQKGMPYKGKVNNQEMDIGYQVVAQIKRTKKTQGSNQVAYIDYYPAQAEGYPFGIDKVFDVISIGKRLGFVEQAGAFYTLPDGSRHQGKNAIGAYLDANPAVYEQIRAKVIEAILAKGGSIEVEEVDAS